MRLKAFIKVMLKSIIREARVMVFMFIVFPVACSLLYGYFQKEMFKPENMMSKFYINIKDEDNSSTTKAFKELLKGEGLKDFIEITEDKEALQVEVVFPKGYEEKLLALKEGEITLTQLTPKGEFVATTLTSIIDKYNKAIQEGLIIEKKIGESSLSEEEKLSLENEIKSKFIEYYSSKSIKTEIYTKGHNLTSFQYYSISIFSFTALILIQSLTGSYYAEKENGVLKRCLAAPMSKTQYFNYTLISNIVFAFIINLVYTLVFRIGGISYEGNFGLLVLIVFTISILQGVFAGFLTTFFKDKRVGGLVVSAMIILSAAVGGSFFPVDKVGNDIVKFIGSIAPNAQIIKVFKGYILENSISAVINPLVIMSLLSLMLYVLSFIKVRVKWEE